MIKLNQTGTVTETNEAIQMCRKAGWGFVISHRSGETEDTFMADYAVAMGSVQIRPVRPAGANGSPNITGYWKLKLS